MQSDARWRESVGKGFPGKRLICADIYGVLEAGGGTARLRAKEAGRFWTLTMTRTGTSWHDLAEDARFSGNWSPNRQHPGFEIPCQNSARSGRTRIGTCARS